MGPLGIVAAGASITTGAASARVALPVDAGGSIPQFVRVTTTVAAYVRVGNSTVVATNADTLLNPEHAIILKVRGQTHIAGIQSAAAGLVNIVPLEEYRL